MMTELSLNVLDIVENSIRANANKVQVEIEINSKSDYLSIMISDNGCGMTKDEVEKVSDPFFTTRTTRNIGLGIPFFKYAAISTGGSFNIISEPNAGTTVHAVFVLSHIDRMPLGDMTSTMYTLITINNNIDFIYTYKVNDKSFILDTREFREILGGIPFHVPQVSTYIKEYLQVNKDEVDNGMYY